MEQNLASSHNSLRSKIHQLRTTETTLYRKKEKVTAERTSTAMRKYKGYNLRRMPLSWIRSHPYIRSVISVSSSIASFLDGEFVSCSSVK